MNYPKALVCGFGVLLLGTNFAAFGAESERIVISESVDRLGWPAPVPVSIGGFTSDAAAILKNDLLFMGMTTTTPEAAQYQINGNNGSRVEARVIDRISKSQVLGKAYTGGNQRSQIHALADDIAKAITHLQGIAQTKIAFKVENGPGRSEVYIADYDGHNSTQVTRDNTIVAGPCWAGRTMLYYSSYKMVNPRIFHHDLPTGERQLITPFSGANISPAVSPNGKKIAMIMSKGGNPNLYVSDLNGSNLKQLTFSKDGESSPCWSPDSQTICFVSRDQGPARLYTISATGGKPQWLRTGLAPNPTEPDWSPDGKWIVFTSMRSNFEICIVKATGGDAITLVEGEDPTWAPNSRAVVFARGHDHAKSLCLLDVPTKQVKTIARISESNSQPSWAR